VTSTPSTIKNHHSFCPKMNMASGEKRDKLFIHVQMANVVAN